MERPPSAAGAATPAAASTPAAPRVSTALPRFLRTHTSEQQRELELKVADLYADLTESEPGAERDELLVLLRDRHTRYLQVRVLRCAGVCPDHLAGRGPLAAERCSCVPACGP
jgi:hypothetical protein